MKLPNKARVAAVATSVLVSGFCAVASAGVRRAGPGEKLGSNEKGTLTYELVKSDGPHVPVVTVHVGPGDSIERDVTFGRDHYRYRSGWIDTPDQPVDRVREWTIRLVNFATNGAFRPAVAGPAVITNVAGGVRIVVATDCTKPNADAAGGFVPGSVVHVEQGQFLCAAVPAGHNEVTAQISYKAP